MVHIKWHKYIVLSAEDLEKVKPQMIGMCLIDDHLIVTSVIIRKIGLSKISVYVLQYLCTQTFMYLQLLNNASVLTLFRKGGGQKILRSSFSPATSTKVGISPPKLSDF